jgi:hypothetical protein
LQLAYSALNPGEEEEEQEKPKHEENLPQQIGMSVFLWPG